MVYERVTASVVVGVFGRFAQQKLLEFLLHFCAGHCTWETSREKERDSSDSPAMYFCLIAILTAAFSTCFSASSVTSLSSHV